MNKKIAFIINLLFIFIFLPHQLNADTVIKGKGNPKISKYVKITMHDYSTKDDKYCYPIFAVEIEKKTKREITEYDFHYTCGFGQNLKILCNEDCHWTKASPELILLNKDGCYTIKIELEKILLETEGDDSSYLGILNFIALESFSSFVRIE